MVGPILNPDDFIGCIIQLSRISAPLECPDAVQFPLCFTYFEQSFKKRRIQTAESQKNMPAA
jgi:hypothetical protein